MSKLFGSGAGTTVIPGVDIRCHAFSHQYRVIKLNPTRKGRSWKVYLRGAASPLSPCRVRASSVECVELELKPRRSRRLEEYRYTVERLGL